MQKKFILAVGLAVLSCLGSGLSAQTTVSFQNGVDGYEGLFDVVIGRNNILDDVDLEFGESNVLGADVENYFLDGSYGDAWESADEKQALLRFDGILAVIPEGATIISASLELTTSPESFSEFSDSAGPYGVSQLLVPFDENTTYNSAFDGFRWIEGETEAPLADGFIDLLPGLTGVADMTEIVQAWVDGDENFGVTVTAGTTNGWAISTSGNSVAELRPKLVVTYTTDPQPVFESGSLTQIAGDAATDMFVATPLGLPAGEGPQLVDGDGISEEGQFIDFNGGETEALIRFNEIFESDGGAGFVPDNATIEKATLVVNTSNYFFSRNVGTNDVFGARQILTDWDGASVFADLAFGDFVDEKHGMISDAEVRFDVTAIVAAWAAGDDNNGINVASTGRTDGWAMLFQTAPMGAPELIIEYSVADFVLGDANNDGVVNTLDVSAFVQALVDPDGYAAEYPDVDPTVQLDMNDDGLFNTEDIAGFVNAILGL